MSSLRHIHYCYKLPSSKEIEKSLRDPSPPSSQCGFDSVEANYTKLTVNDDEYRPYFDPTLSLPPGSVPCELCVEQVREARDILTTIRNDGLALDNKGIAKIWRRFDRRQKWRRFFASFRVVLPKARRVKLIEQDKLIAEVEDPNYRCKALTSLNKRYRDAAQQSEMVDKHPHMFRQALLDEKDEKDGTEHTTPQSDEEYKSARSGNPDSLPDDVPSKNEQEVSEHPQAGTQS